MKKIMFCGGGSAGHVMPNIALIDELCGEYEICYAGTNGIEKTVCKSRGIIFYEFERVKLRRGAFWENFAIPAKLIKAVRQCGAILDEVKPDLLFCKGGYASLPPALAAKKRGVDILTHESDLSLGLANKIISRYALETLCAFPETAQKVKRGKYAGTPMRKEMFRSDRLSAKRKFGLDMRPTLLVFGGGSGSEKINGALREIIAEICADYNVLHLCGEGRETATDVYGYKQIGFTDDMGAVYACADCAVARCGSNSAHELLAFKIPTLFIPLENGSSRGDQVANAEYFKDKGLCRVLREKELCAAQLKMEIYSLFRDGNIKAALAQYNCPRGNTFIINEITKCLSPR